jgi:PAS domain S-box-containing protein
MASADLPPEVTKFASAEGAVVVVNREGLIVLMNPDAEKLFGVSSDDIAGEPVEYLVPEKKRFGHQAYRRGYVAEPSDREMDPGLEPELERLDDGTIVPIAVRLEPVKAGDMLYVAAHVTEREAAS